jgi:hypothetical protein
MAGTHNFLMEKGATFDRTVTWTGADGRPVDLTGFSGRLQARDQAGALALEFSSEAGTLILGGPAGTVRLFKSPAQTAADPSGSWPYDLLLTRAADGYAKRLLEGLFTSRPRVTR